MCQNEIAGGCSVILGFSNTYAEAETLSSLARFLPFHLPSNLRITATLINHNAKRVGLSNHQHRTPQAEEHELNPNATNLIDRYLPSTPTGLLNLQDDLLSQLQQEKPDPAFGPQV